MKPSKLVAVLALALSAPTLPAQQDQQPPESYHPDAHQQSNAIAQENSDPLDLLVEEMQSHIDKMLQTQDPAERQKLMEAHRSKMHDLRAKLQDMPSQAVGRLGDQGIPMGKRMLGNGMMAHMREMQADMEKIIATDDPVERRKRWEEHREKMQEHHQQMQNMMGMMHGGMMGGGHGTGADARWMQQVEKRLDLIQAILERLGDD